MCGVSGNEYGELMGLRPGNKEGGDEDGGTSGVREVRYADSGKGKSGGVRDIYSYYDESSPLYALMIYGKNEKADLSAAERKVVSALAAAIKKAARQRK